MVTQLYKILVRCLRCSTVALANILQMKLVQWLCSRDEPRAADWFEEYWTGPRGHYMLAHCGVGGTNYNCGVEGGWNGVKKEICGTAGSTSSLAVGCVVPSLLRFLGDKSKEQASYLRADTRSRHLSMMFSFPSQATSPQAFLAHHYAIKELPALPRPRAADDGC